MKRGHQRDSFTPMFFAALFTKANIRKQPRCAPMDEWIKEMQYIHNGMLFSLRKKEILPFVTKEEDKNCMISLTCEIYKSQTQKQRL